MRSLFHFPFPCTTTLAATVPLQPEMCHRPHSAPMRRQRRSPALLSAAARPRSRAYLDPAHYHPLPEPLAGKNRPACIPFSPNARKRPPSWQLPPEMHAFRDQDGNILAPCIHFRAQSGDSGYMARESCRQGPSFASRSPKSRMARRCCQRRAAFPRQRPAVRPNGLCALRRGPGLLAVCAPPCHLACARRGLRPRHLARVHRRRLMRVALRRPHRAHRAPPSAAPPIAVGMSCRSGSSCRPRAAHADASRYLRAAPIPPAARTHRV